MRARRPIERQEEARELALPGEAIAYTLKRSSARRTLSLRVSEAGTVTVNAPLRMAAYRIDAFMHKHADWLRRQLAQAQTLDFAWREGIELPYLGESRRLALDAGTLPFVCLIDDRLLVGGDPETAARLVPDWYRERAASLLSERLAGHADRLGLARPRFRLSDAASRWGSLSPAGVVSLNWRLVKASWAEIDYVICHELAHLRVPNHSAAFWREVERLLPGYEAAKMKLRRDGRNYFLF